MAVEAAKVTAADLEAKEIQGKLKKSLYTSPKSSVSFFHPCHSFDEQPKPKSPTKLNHFVIIKPHF